MHRLPLALAALLPVTAGAADALDPALVKQLIEWRRDIHQHPELGSHETRTAALVAAQLKKLGYEVRTGIAVTGVVGVLKGGKPGPKLVIRADMDALPVTEEVDLPFASKVRARYNDLDVGVMHACGHDAHTAMLLGIATALAGRKNDLHGDVMVLFQPAEEGPPRGEEGGAPRMVKEGVFRDFKPDFVFGMHVVSDLPVGNVALRPGGAMASSDTFRFDVVGRQTHGAQPWRGTDPIVTAAQIVTDAQTIVSRQIDINRNPAVVTFGMFHGGTRFNIVPESVHLEGTVRTFDDDQRQQALAALRNVTEHVAAAQGARIEHAEIPAAASNPVNYNDPAWTARVRTSLERELGREHVEEARRWTASEDFPHLGRSVSAPSVYFFVGATPAGQDPAKAPANHSPKFFLDEGALEVGVRAMLAAASDALGETPAAGNGK